MKRILLSIKPKYVDKIISGEKIVEYRKRVVTDVDLILIYATSPIQKVVAEFRVEEILSGTPKELWDATKEMGGINEKDYFAYYNGRDKAFAYKISDLNIYEKPLLLSDLGIKRAPQSFQYINGDY